MNLQSRTGCGATSVSSVLIRITDGGLELSQKMLPSKVLLTAPHSRVILDEAGSPVPGGDPLTHEILVRLRQLLGPARVIAIDAWSDADAFRTQHEADVYATTTSRVVGISVADNNRRAGEHTKFGRRFEASCLSGRVRYHVDIHSAPPGALGGTPATLTIMTSDQAINKAFQAGVQEATNAASHDAVSFLRSCCADKDASGLLVNRFPTIPAVAIEFAVEKNAKNASELSADVLDAIAVLSEFLKQKLDAEH